MPIPYPSRLITVRPNQFAFASPSDRIAPFATGDCHTMIWVDWVILGILGLSSLIGLIRGLIKEAMSLVVWALALFVATHFKAQASVLLEQYIQTPSLREMSAFGGLFAATLFVGAMVNFVLGQIVKMTGLGGTDRVLGAVFGGARGFLVVMAIIIFLPPIVPIDKDNWWHQSRLIPEFQAFEDSAKVIFSHLAQVYQRITS
jgi:membrane protein required for colicin V production